MVEKGTCSLNCPSRNAHHNVARLRRPQDIPISAQKDEPSWRKASRFAPSQGLLIKGAICWKDSPKTATVRGSPYDPRTTERTSNEPQYATDV